MSSIVSVGTSLDPRPSISTERTSMSAWSKQQECGGAEACPPRQPLQIRRQTGSYRLEDFIIQRTLGTGSFGRVHLGGWSALPRAIRPVLILTLSSLSLSLSPPLCSSSSP